LTFSENEDFELKDKKNTVIRIANVLQEEQEEKKDEEVKKDAV
jgi:hypothetical protein